MLLHPRRVLSVLQERLKHRSIVVLTGARQTGKTTLVRDLLPKVHGTTYAYFSLDDPDERLQLADDPVRRLETENQLVVLDEIQKQPELLDVVKFLSDRRPERRFLLLGSSQILLLERVRETLAGRATLLELWPLAMAERSTTEEAPPCGLDRVWQDGQTALREMKEATPAPDEARLWRGWGEQQLLWGGYPGLEPLPEQQRAIWLRDFRRTYLERDLADLGRVADLDQFALAQNLLAARTAQLLSYSEVSRELGVAVNTVKRYTRFLEISYQVVLLRPMRPTATARLVKSPKLYWTDPGLARMLSGRMDTGDGAIFETAVFDELLRWRSWQADPPEIHFYRTHGGLEVDFILHSPNRLVAIEAKSERRSHTGRGIQSLDRVLETLTVPGISPDAPRTGIVVNRARELRQLNERIWAVPHWRLFGPAIPAAQG